MVRSHARQPFCNPVSTFEAQRQKWLVVKGQFNLALGNMRTVRPFPEARTRKWNLEYINTLPMIGKSGRPG
jgi:hypothetical protein